MAAQDRTDSVEKLIEANAADGLEESQASSKPEELPTSKPEELPTSKLDERPAARLHEELPSTGSPLISSQTGGKIDRLLRRKPLYITVVAFALFTLLTPFVAGKYIRIMDACQILSAFTFFAITAFSIGRDRDLLKSLSKTKHSWLKFTAGDFVQLTRSLTRGAKENPVMLQLLSIMTIASIAGSFETFFLQMWHAGGLLWTLTAATGLAALGPLSAVAALSLGRHLTIPRLKANALIPRLQQNMLASVRDFLVYRYPYLSAYSAFMVFSLIVSFAPMGVGTGFAGWLHASAVDANMANPDDLNQKFVLIVSACVFLALAGALRHWAVHLSANFQILLSRLFINKDTLLEAVMETANVRSTRLVLPEAHPQLDSIWGTLVWISFCYAVLFFLVAFSPQPLQWSIPNWLNATVGDAGYTLNLYEHFNLRLFIASVIAACGAVPVAVSSCAFLPRKKAKSLLISPQGILSAASFLGLWPMKSWNDLKSVTVNNYGKANKEQLCLAFGLGSTIKLKTSQCLKEELVELITAADEYATGCKFDPQVLALRLQLQEETRARTLTEAAKFSATIFSPLKTGDQLNGGAYRIVRKLAGKALSAVYLARDQQDRHVVIKQFVLPSSAQHAEALCESFEREYKILSSLHHEGMAEVNAIFEEKGARYIVMEYVRGHDLRSIVQRHGARSEKVVLRWASDIARLMLVMHGQKPMILHRDLTPDNIMEDENGKIKLIDFGAAHQLMEGVTGTLIGKQCYIAPEQLRGKAMATSDIYSFGCTLYFLLTGKDPAALKQCDPTSEGSNVSPTLAALVRKCTEFEERDRYQSFEQIIADLDKTDSVKVCFRQFEGEKA